MKINLPFIRLMDSRKNLKYGTLSGPVLPGQHMYFPLAAGKLYSVQGRDAGKPFCYIDHF